MTGANRLLVGFAWLLIIFRNWWRTRNRAVDLLKSNTTELFFLLLVSAFAFVILFKDQIDLFDFIALLAIFGAYMWRVSRSPKCADHDDDDNDDAEPGPAAILETLTLGTAIGQAPLGSVAATGGKLTFEADAAYTFPLAGRPATIEVEVIRSRFSGSKRDVFGGYVMGQVSLFDAAKSGDLDLFLRHDFVDLGQDTITGRARRSALRAGFNYNLPFTGKFASLHLEYAHNTVSGPAAIVTAPSPGDEFRIGVRISLQRYQRH